MLITSNKIEYSKELNCITLFVLLPTYHLKDDKGSLDERPNQTIPS